MLYGLDIDSEQLDLQKLHENNKDGLHTNCIIIGNDTCAGKILLINNDEEQGIFFWDQGWARRPPPVRMKIFIKWQKVSNPLSRD